jgi:hypothetical protein
VLTCLWSNSSISSLCGQADLNILDISPSSGNKSMPIRLVAAAAVADPRCAMVAPASFWRLGSGACQWSTAPLASVSVVSRGRGNRSDPQVSFSPFPILFTILVLA